MARISRADSDALAGSAEKAARRCREPPGRSNFSKRRGQRADERVPEPLRPWVRARTSEVPDV
jgi:hypothetical protein